MAKLKLCGFYNNSMQTFYELTNSLSDMITVWQLPFWGQTNAWESSFLSLWKFKVIVINSCNSGSASSYVDIAAIFKVCCSTNLQN